MGKRKYTKRNKDYWEGKSKSVASNQPLESDSQGFWEPMDTSIDDGGAGFRREYSRASNSSAGRTSTRKNRIAFSKTPNRFANIDELDLPYVTRHSDGTISIRDAALLCQKAYANVGAFRNSIDVMTEFSNADIYLKGGNKQSRQFIEKWMERINIGGFIEQFFREYYRSGNVFIYKFEGNFTPEDLKKIKNLYSDAATKMKLPVKYSVFNPSDIVMTGASSLDKGLYKKVLSQYQLMKIRAKATPEDLDIYNSLPRRTREEIDKGQFGAEGISIELDLRRLFTVFYKKQDYEPFAIPFGYCVLDDIDHKLALKKIDRAISRVVQQVVLLVKMGNEPDKHGINYRAMQAMRQMLENETVGRTIVSDYTTDMKFVIPEVGTILDPKKYEMVNKDIQEGLQNIIFTNGEKFANQNTKVKVFLERLKEGRKAFINEFLQPEIKRICREMGFKAYPTVKFQDVDLKDEVQTNRIYLRLLELGILDAQQTFKAMETGILPEDDEMVESQKKYIEQRKEGYYNPLVGGQPVNEEEQADNTPKTNAPNPNTTQNGRPAGTNTPQSTKNVSPIGTSKANQLFSLKGLKSTFYDVSKLINKMESSLRKKFKVSELNDNQKDLVFNMAQTIIVNRAREDWDKEMRKAIKDPEEVSASFLETNSQNSAIDEIAATHDLDSFQAALLYHSKWQDEE